MTISSEERLLKILQSTPDQRVAIDRILSGNTPTQVFGSSVPLLMKLGEGAKLLGVSRATVWRMIKAGTIRTVEIVPGTHRVRRDDLEGIASRYADRVGGVA